MSTSSVTPMMSQFLKIKSQYTDALLFYRMGDFYELFFDDAKIASSALNITLTKRGKFNGQEIPMCGVPYHASETYLLNLIRKGYKVAICEQLEKPEEAKKRGYKAVVRRDVVRLITPGTLTEERLLNDEQNNFILSCNKNESGFSTAWTDISTGEFYCTSIAKDDFLSLINRISPSEILIPENYEQKIYEFKLSKNIFISTLPPQNFDAALGRKKLEKFFNIKSLSVFGNFSDCEVGSMASLLSYLEITQCTQSIPLTPPIKEVKDSYLKIDAASRQSLELTKTLSGQTVGSLMSSINQTLTSGGSRLLQERLQCPSTDVEKIKKRQKVLEFFIKNQSLMNTCRNILKQTPDMQRSLTRLTLNRGTPKDLSTIRNCLRSINEIKNTFKEKKIPDTLSNLIYQLNGYETLLVSLQSALVENPPNTNKGEPIICSEFDKNLKELRRIKDEAHNLIINLQLKYVKTTNINSLKIKFNNILGYFIETPISQSKKLATNDFSELFIHRQTTTNCSRFSTMELSKMASNIINAQEKANDLEQGFLKKLIDLIIQNSELLQSAARTLSELDFYSSLSFQSISCGWIKPTVDNSKNFTIIGGRHPVVELALRNSGDDNFVSNDCDLKQTNNGILLLTGPNMAGKSTYLRQNALIVILSQIGSYVPAEKAHIGIVDQIFSRVGASDDLSKGNSTFMIEMIETASILKNATRTSFVIMDEIGRGTSTYDGLSIAWATLEYIHNVINCRTLFATHYHELTQLQTELPNLKNAKVAIREWKDEVIFLYEVKFGTADKSYGVQVAKLAGLPSNVTNRANEILNSLEDKGENSSVVSNFTHSFQNSTEKRETKSLEILDTLLSVNTDEITPKQALSIIDQTITDIKKFIKS